MQPHGSHGPRTILNTPSIPVALQNSHDLVSSGPTRRLLREAGAWLLLSTVTSSTPSVRVIGRDSPQDHHSRWGRPEHGSRACYVGKGEENFNRSHKELVFTKTAYLAFFRPGHCPWLCSSLTPDPRHNGLTLPCSSAAPQAWHSLSDNLCRQDLLALSESWTVFLLRLWVLGRQQRHDLSPVIKLMNFEWMKKWIQIMGLESPDLLHIIWDALGLI